MNSKGLSIYTTGEPRYGWGGAFSTMFYVCPCDQVCEASTTRIVKAFEQY